MTAFNNARRVGIPVTDEIYLLPKMENKTIDRIKPVVKILYNEGEELV